MSKSPAHRDSSPMMSRTPPTNSTNVTTYAKSRGRYTKLPEETSEVRRPARELLEAVGEHGYPGHHPYYQRSQITKTRQR